MPSHRDFIVQPEDAKVEAILARIDERMSWMRSDAEERKRQMDAMLLALTQLERSTATLQSAVKALTEDFVETAKQEIRIRALEDQCKAWAPAMTRWQKIHDTFIITVLKWVLGAALSGAVAASAIAKVFTK